MPEDQIPANTDAAFLAPARPDLAPFPRAVPASSSTYSCLRAYWRVILRWRWDIVAVTVTVVALVAIISFKTKPVYRATSRLEVDSDTPEVQSLSDLYRNIPTDETFLQTQLDVIDSNLLAWSTIQALGLGNLPEFNRGATPGAGSLPKDWRSQRSELLRTFKRHLHIDLVRGTRVVEVSFDSTDPDLAARVVTMLVSGYMKYNFRKTYDATRQASGWMEQQLGELKARVEQSQRAMVDYERRNALAGVAGSQNNTEQDLADLNRELISAQSDRAQKQALFEVAKSKDFPAGLVTKSELLNRLEEQRAGLNLSYLEALEQYGPNFPKVVRLRDQIHEMEALIGEARQRSVGEIQEEYDAAVKRENLLSEQVAREKAEVGKVNELLIQYNLLKGEFETNRRLYENLLQRLKETTLAAGMRATNIHLIDAAFPPTIPVRPKKLFNIAIALIMGVIVGTTVAFSREALDTAIASVAEVERLTAAPTLAVIPSVEPARFRAHLKQLNGNHRERSPEAWLALAAACSPASPLSESYRALRTSIRLSLAPRPPQIILVTSSQSSEGKTCTSLNLALTLAQCGSRTLVVDADLRRPAVGRVLGAPSTGGLSSVLTGAQRLDEALQSADGLSGLTILAAGPRPPNPAELLASPAMAKLLGKLRQRFDQIVVDSPPLLPVTDATILSSLVDGVVVVIECSVIERDALVRAFRMLETAGAKILGTVVNKVDFKRDGCYGSSYRAYYESRFSQSSN
jgi:polysaccharide biosynthesis transport protein